MAPSPRALASRVDCILDEQGRGTQHDDERRLRLLQYGIRCNCICPARVHTPFVDGFLTQHYPGRSARCSRSYRRSNRSVDGKPAEIAALALYLCSEEAGSSRQRLPH